MALKTYTSDEVANLKTRMQKAEEEMNRLRMGFYAGVEEYETMHDAAEVYIAASYAFQKAKWGKVRMRLSPAGVLR